MHGRTIATALAGDAPNNTVTNTPMLEPLPGQLEVQFTKQLIDNETNRVIGNSIISSKPLVALKSGLYKFDYTLTPKQLNLLSCTNTPGLLWLFVQTEIHAYFGLQQSARFYYLYWQQL